MMQALGEMHAVNVSILLLPGGELPDLSLEVIGIAETRSASNGGTKRSVSQRAFYPNRNSQTLEGCLYKLLHGLDVACSELWVQTQID